jgi:hypothetical protein
MRRGTTPHPALARHLLLKEKAFTPSVAFGATSLKREALLAFPLRGRCRRRRRMRYIWLPAAFCNIYYVYQIPNVRMTFPS